MIGEPTNFVHTAHVGSGDLFSGMNSVSMSRQRKFHLRQNTGKLYMYIVAKPMSLKWKKESL